MGVKINIYNDCSFKYLPKKKVIESLKNVFKYEKIQSNVFVNVIYISDSDILKINRKYLKHNSTTDVITFFLGEEKNTLEGEIYISIDTAFKQAKQYKVSPTNEIQRLAVHGALHLIGYDDKTIKKREEMHNLENKYIGNYR